MKKILTLLLTGALAFGVAACTSTTDHTHTPTAPTPPTTPTTPTTPITPAPTTFRIAMVTDIGDIDDGSFNQGTWEGVVAFAEANNISHRYYRPLEQGTAASMDAIALAVRAGAEVIVTPGFLFEPAIYEAQKLYPNVKFILIDGVPHAGDYATYETASNTLSVLFEEQESGFLAGYAAVKEGFRDLGFLGGIAVPAVVRFGIGFIAGANYAAAESGLTINLGTPNYLNLGNFGSSDENKVVAATFYLQGREVIFVAAGAAGFNAMSAAEEVDNKWVIGVDVDQGPASSRVLTSAMKALDVAVQDGLQAWLDGTWEGGRTVFMNATNNGVALPMATSRFTNFTLADYERIYALIASGELVVPRDYVALVTFATTYGIDPTTLPTEAKIIG
jgi:basic membrane protein A and related proteins